MSEQLCCVKAAVKNKQLISKAYPLKKLKINIECLNEVRTINPKKTYFLSSFKLANHFSLMSLTSSKSISSSESSSKMGG